MILWPTTTYAGPKPVLIRFSLFRVAVRPHGVIGVAWDSGSELPLGHACVDQALLTSSTI